MRNDDLISRIALGSALAAAVAVHADLTYVDVPRVTVQDAAGFREVFEGARSGVVRVTVFGDSQETAPWGAGDRYLAHLNARFAQIYGPAGESQLFTNHTSTVPPMWLATMQESTNWVPPRVVPSAVLPGVSFQALLFGGKSWQSSACFVFLHDAALCTDPVLSGGAWFDPSGSYRAEVLMVTHDGDPAIRWRNAPTNSNFPDPGARGIQGGVLSSDPTLPSGSFAWASTPVLSRGTKAHVR